MISTQSYVCVAFIVGRLAQGAMIPSQPIKHQPVPVRVLKQDWSMPVVAVAPAPPAYFSEAEVEHIAPARIHVQNRQASVLILSSTRPYNSSPPVSALIAVLAGSVLLLFAYGFIPHAQSHWLRLRALELKQDLIV